jgi:5-methylthioadenosine/S-adenosylhomocysteine deaminase
MDNRFFIYADYIYYNGNIEQNNYLYVEDGLIKGLFKENNSEIKTYIRRNSAIFPSFINTHTHLPMVYFRGLADDLPLIDWLKKHIWPKENKWLSSEFVYDATLLSMCELIHSGTSVINDMYFYTEKIAEAIIKAKLNAVIGIGVLDFPTKFARNINEYLNKANTIKEMYKCCSNIKIAICPHSLYTVSPDNFKKCLDYSSSHNLLLHTHLAESNWEIEEIKSRYNKRPVDILNDIGAFDLPSIFAHCVNLNGKEISLLGQKHVNIAHCLESNLKLANGISPIKELLNAGCNITIGTDGAASNNDLDLLGEISSVAKVHKGLNLDSTILDAKTVFEMSTLNAAKALKYNKKGILKENYSADFFVISLNKAHASPIYNILSHLIYAAKSSDITDLFNNGIPLMLDNKILTLDEKAIIEKSNWWGKKIKDTY